MMYPVPSSHRRRGVALVLVLGCLVLLSILVVAFLASVKSEMTSSSGYASSSDVKQRSQTAVNMVIAQIQEASSGTTTSWTSQPGLVRTFLPTGAAGNAYKLYSSGTMVADSAFDPNSNNDVPNDWKSRPNEYTDLNQPVLVADASGSITKSNLKYSPNFPILDPGAIGTVKGFSIDGNDVAPPNYANIDPTVNNPAPMPVQWLYILQDGSVRAMDATSKTVSGATKDNPIVSRVAFWTDDDTCKININTAAGDEWDDTTSAGSFMDMPRGKTTFEEQTLSAKQPVNHEYQRYPGHPATTYLSAVFPSLTRSQIADVIPRISYGGSRGGTVNTTVTGTNPAALPFSDGTPLYATVDELRYVRSSTSRTRQTIFTPRQIEQSSFFLTAQSRAPELNIFNRPRISLWPEPANVAERTSFDKTVAFCSTVAGEPFYFVRNDSTDPTNDYENYSRNKELYSFLQRMTELDVPGWGGNFLAKYPIPTGEDTPERDQILTEIFDYVRGSINLVDSGSGAFPFAGPIYAGDLRVAPSGAGHVVPIQIGHTRGFGRSMTVYCPILQLVGLRADVVPNGAIDKVTGTSNVGDGYYRGPSENAQLAKIRTKEVQALFVMDTFSPSQGPVRFVPNLIFNVSGLNKLTLDGVNMGFPANTEVNYNRYAPDHEYAWGGYVNHAAFFFDRLISSGTVWKKLDGTANAYSWASSKIAIDKEYKKDTLRISGGDDITVEIYARDKTGTKIPKLLQKISLNFPTIDVPTPTVKGAYAWSYTAAINPSIPTTLPVIPDAIVSATGTNNLNSPGVIHTGYNSGSVGGQTIFDVSRSLVPTHGDMRLVLARQEIPSSVFMKGRGYDSPTDANYGTLWKVVNGEESSGGMVGAGPTSGIGGNHYTTSGKLVPDVTYNQHIGFTGAQVPANDHGPIISSSVSGAMLRGQNGSSYPGDWDTGMGGVYDGPYINKADEGERGNGAYISSNATISIGSIFSPSRQVPSPVVLGSLSTGVLHNRPWQTLLFCPNPPAKSQHPGLATPPDHLLLDLFWMPVVEPYAISEPFSTAGKVNLNYQIVPFTNIERSTGMQAVLRSTRVSAIPNTDGMTYKSTTTATQYRHLINIPETLKGFQNRFVANRPFRSASEICEMFLVPQTGSATLAGIVNWWDDYKLTGDNLRESPYSQLYSRLTTKSNTYTVHVRVQSLKKVSRDKPSEWVDGTDKVLGEYRGSFGIERYLDPNIPNYDADTQPLTAYRFRTFSTKHFTP
jgi:uncharacterized protein (TIGR02600 family)